MTNGGQQGRGWAPDPHLTPPAVYTPVEFPVRRLGTGLAAGKSDFSFKHHVMYRKEHQGAIAGAEPSDPRHSVVLPLKEGRGGEPSRHRLWFGASECGAGR